jgi:glycine/D-amino acid oxidase-like deaminating enzyme
VNTTSYWLEEPSESFPKPASHGEPDVAIVGGGVTGCSCALTLAEAGLKVRLHEAREIAGGASGRNGGFALRGGVPAYDEACATMGHDQARLLWELTERSLDRLEALAGDAFRRVGSLRLASGSAEREALEHELEALRADGFAVERAGDLPAPLARLFDGAILHPGDGAIQPARWVRRLARRAAAAGAEIVEGSRVELGSAEAPVVVLALDGGLAELAPELAGVIRPVRGQVLVTEQLPEPLFERPHYARDGLDYWQQLPDRRLVIGGRRDMDRDAEYTAVEETSAAIQSQIERLATELLGWPPAITHRWAGIWGETPDRLPLVGPLPSRGGVWIAGGYSGHGNVLGLACGDLVARAILGETGPELLLFDPTRPGLASPVEP